MAMMTPRERIQAVMGGKQPDRPPIFECLIHDAVLEHFGGRPLAVGDTEGVVRACSRCLDLCHPVLTPAEPRQWRDPDGTEHVQERWNAWTIPPPPDPAAMERRLREMIERNEAWQPPPDAELKAGRDRVNAWGGEMVSVPVGGSVWILPFDMTDMTAGAYAWADYPDLVRAWNRARNARARRRLEALLRADAGPDASPVAMVWNDIAFKNSLLYSPELLEELFYPHLADFVDLLHAHGRRVLFHCDGLVTLALPRLVDCGIDALNPLEFSAGCTIEEFRRIGGRRLVLVGGVDAVNVLAFGTPDQVREHVRRLMAQFRDDGNLIVGSSSGEVDNSMPLANVLAMYETVWNDGR